MVGRLVAICLLGVCLSFGSGYFNYILCLHLDQDCCAHVEERNLADISFGELHIDLFQDEFTSAKVFKGKDAATCEPLRSKVCKVFLPTPSLLKNNNARDPVAFLRTVRLIR